MDGTHLFVSWPPGDLCKVAHAETTPTYPAGTKPWHEGSLQDAGCEVLRGSHPTPHILEPEPHRTSAWRCHPFCGEESTQICPGTCRPARGLSRGQDKWPGRSLQQLMWHHYSPTILLAWGCCGHTSSCQKCVAAGSPCTAERGQDLALWMENLGTGAPVCHCRPQEPDWPWGCFIWLMEVKLLLLFFTDTPEGLPNPSEYQGMMQDCSLLFFTKSLL